MKTTPLPTIDYAERVAKRMAYLAYLASSPISGVPHTNIILNEDMVWIYSKKRRQIGFSQDPEGFLIEVTVHSKDVGRQTELFFRLTNDGLAVIRTGWTLQNQSFKNRYATMNDLYVSAVQSIEDTNSQAQYSNAGAIATN